jgi:hypothetical protein
MGVRLSAHLLDIEYCRAKVGEYDGDVEGVFGTFTGICTEGNMCVARNGLDGIRLAHDMHSRSNLTS